MSVLVSISPDADSIADEVVERLEEWAAECIEDEGRFVMSLAGGNTPRKVYDLWARTSKLNWSLVDFIFGDERAVPTDHPESNYGMVREALLDGLPRPPHVHRMLGEDPNPEHAALQYEHALDKLLDEDMGIDVALLGLGNDGHTASLFPHSPALDEQDRRVVATLAPDGKTHRLTLTFGELRRAQRIVFLVVGEEKAAIVKEILESEFDPVRLPAQALLRDNILETHLFLDEAAASQLEEEQEY